MKKLLIISMIFLLAGCAGWERISGVDVSNHNPTWWEKLDSDLTAVYWGSDYDIQTPHEGIEHSKQCVKNAINAGEHLEHVIIGNPKFSGAKVWVAVGFTEEHIGHGQTMMEFNNNYYWFRWSVDGKLIWVPGPDMEPKTMYNLKTFRRIIDAGYCAGFIINGDIQGAIPFQPVVRTVNKHKSVNVLADIKALFTRNTEIYDATAESFIAMLERIEDKQMELCTVGGMTEGGLGLNWSSVRLQYDEEYGELLILPSNRTSYSTVEDVITIAHLYPPETAVRIADPDMGVWWIGDLGFEVYSDCIMLVASNREFWPEWRAHHNWMIQMRLRDAANGHSPGGN